MMKIKHIVSAVAGAMLASAMTIGATVLANGDNTWVTVRGEDAPPSQSTPTTYNPGLTLCGLSDNGLYAIAVEAGDQEVDNPRMAGGQLIDLRDYSVTEIRASRGWADVNDVADDGTVVGSESGIPASWSPATGEWTKYSVPSPWGGGAFTAVTPDGHYGAGYYTDAADEYKVAPMLIDLTTGQDITPANLPKHDMAGEDKKQNVFYGISADGRYVLGQMSQSYWLPVSLFSYVYDRQTDTWDPIGYTYDASTKKFSPKAEYLHFVLSQSMSCDGMWVTGSAYVVRGGGESEGGSEGVCPYRYNVADKSFELYSSASDENVSGNRITNDGEPLCATPWGNPYPTAVVRSGKYFVSIDQIVSQVYGLEADRFFPTGVSGAFRAVSADGLTAVLETYDGSYILRMPESFATAAAQVNLLANYSVNIPDGSTISRVSELQITFDRPIDCLSYPQSINLMDADGKTVRSALGFSISPTNPNTVVLTFRGTSLTPGKDYTIVIPAGMVWLKDDQSIKSDEIKIHYKGRQEGPIQVVKVSPADGATLTQLNSSPDYIAVTFDTPVAISNNAQCSLYNAADGTLIAQMVASTEGNTAYFFPTAPYQLYKGSDYRVVIAAGSVTDLSGGGACEEIVISYHGAYVRDLSPDDIYVFNAACDTYDNFIFWSTERNEPGAIPQQWGFEADNPWILVRDNEQSEDWALAAHSMFTTPGESDDWLVTPQLHIPDATTYLAFDAQSYLRNKDDVLKVYVYTSDAVYNYFSDELAATFRDEGDLVFDQVIPAGATEQGLSGEWTRYTVPLDKYAGKNVYIAFVNNNYDKSAIFIDDVQVIRNIDFLLTNQTPQLTIDVNTLTVSGLVSLGVEGTTYKGIELTLLDAEGGEIDKITDTDATLAYGDTYRFAFSKPLPVEPGYETAYSIRINSGDKTTEFAYTVKDLLFEVKKKVVLEEYTGSECGNCPLGIQAISNLQRMFPDNFIAVTLRTYMNDMYGTGITDYTNYLGLVGAPTGRINRGAILSPMVQTSLGYQYFGRGVMQSDGTEAYLWADAVQDELGVPAEASVNLTANYDPESGRLEIPCTVRFALNVDDTSVGLYAVVVENNLLTYQRNYFSTTTDANLGPWGAGGMYGQSTVTSWLASDVARFTVNPYGGSPLMETDFEAGRDYEMTLSADMLATRVTNTANCHVVVMLIDRSNGRVINAEMAPLTTSGITDVTTDGGEAEYYTLQGIKTEHPQHGTVYVKVVGGVATKILY